MHALNPIPRSIPEVRLTKDKVATAWFLPRRSTLTNLLVAEELITNWIDEGSAVDLI